MQNVVSFLTEMVLRKGSYVMAGLFRHRMRKQFAFQTIAIPQRVRDDGDKYIKPPKTPLLESVAHSVRTASFFPNKGQIVLQTLAVPQRVRDDGDKYKKENRLEDKSV